MIPKKIHYCWFGRGKKNELSKKCIESWKRYCPDYEIIEWNEDNFNINLNPYTKSNYEQKQYAFLSDYVRLLVIYREGGIYFDVDVEAIRSFDDLLVHKAFFGFETNAFVATGLGFGAEPGNPIVKQMIDEYERLVASPEEKITCPVLNTQSLVKWGLVKDGDMQDLGEAQIYPSEYFNPYDDLTGKLCKTNNTYSIHWYGKSWVDKKLVLRSKLLKPIRRLLGFKKK